jgi:hypothetical protein
MCMFCRSLFVLLSFFFWLLCCLSFFDLRILITPLVSSNSSYFKNDRHRYKFIILGRDVIYFVKHETKGKRGYTENELISMMEFLNNNIDEFGRHIFQQIIGIPMGINCVPLLTDLSLYSHEAECIQKLIKEKN